MWLQEDNKKPVWFPVKDETKAQKVVEKGQVTFKGVTYKVVGLGSKDDLNKVLDVFYNDNEQIWENYKKLKEKVKQFKKTGVWLND